MKNFPPRLTARFIQIRPSILVRNTRSRQPRGRNGHSATASRTDRNCPANRSRNVSNRATSASEAVFACRQIVQTPPDFSIGRQSCIGIHTSPSSRNGAHANPSEISPIPASRSTSSVTRSSPCRGATHICGSSPCPRKIASPARIHSNCKSFATPANSVRPCSGISPPPTPSQTCRNPCKPIVTPAASSRRIRSQNPSSAGPQTKSRSSFCGTTARIGFNPNRSISLSNRSHRCKSIVGQRSSNRSRYRALTPPPVHSPRAAAGTSSSRETQTCSPSTAPSPAQFQPPHTSASAPRSAPHPAPG